MSRKSSSSTAIRIVGIVGQVFVGLAAVLVIAYFLATSAPGKNLVGSLISEDIEGTAALGDVVPDPAGGALSILDLRMIDHDGNEVITLGQASMHLESLGALARSEIEKIFARKGRIYARVDEDGNVNLASFFKEEPKEEPTEPSPFNVKEIDIADVEMSIETPRIDMWVGPIRMKGQASSNDQGQPSGSIEGGIESFRIEPQTEALAKLLEALLGTEPPFVFGPLNLDGAWKPDVIAIKTFTIDLPAGLFLSISGHIEGPLDGELSDQTAQLSIVLNWKKLPLFTAKANISDTQKSVHLLVGKLSLPDIPITEYLTLTGVSLDGLKAQGRVENKGWNADVELNQLRFPGLKILEHPIPAISVELLKISANPEHIHGQVKGVHLSTVPTREMTLKDVDLESRFNMHFVGDTTALFKALQAGASDEEQFELLSKHWSHGDLFLRFAANSVTSGKGHLPEPVVVELRGAGLENHRVELEATVKPGIPGDVTAKISGVLPPETGARKFSVEFNDLDLGPLLAAMPLPGMLANVTKNFSGIVSGGFEMTLQSTDSETVTVSRCDIQLVTSSATLKLQAPSLPQILDLNQAPGKVSLLMVLSNGGVIKFGDGQLVLTKTARQPTK